MRNFQNSGNRPPWNQWSYAGRELRKRSETETQIEKESGELLLETRGKKGRSKKKGASLIIETESGKTIEAEKSMKIDEPDAISLNVSLIVDFWITFGNSFICTSTHEVFETAEI